MTPDTTIPTAYPNLRKWTLPNHYMGETWPDYYSAGVGQSRDSDDLESSNFAVMLARLGGESETVQVVRESHWAVGWVEWIAIHETDTAALGIADRLKGALNDYPILDEEDYGRREQNSADQTWRDCYDWRARIAYIRAHASQFEPHDWRDLRACVKGEYFGGYAGELLN